jgi:three-Cys-motif partner protein
MRTMPDELPTTWPADAHTLTKHQILKNYFEAWAPILAHAKGVASPELLFVDGFAGPGQYSTGEPGSPIVAINAILDHALSIPRPVRFRMIELCPERFRVLCARIESLRPRIEASSRVVVEAPILGECDTEIRKLIAERRTQRLPVGPALFFLDQFGYANVPMDLIRMVMENPKCEVLSYLNCKRMNAYLSDETKWPTITAAYGDESWNSALSMHGEARQHHLIETYKQRIRSLAGVKYVWSFAMFGKNNELLYWLIFSTNSLKGLEQMKKAMWKADDSGSFRFSDRDAADPQGFLCFDDMRSDAYHADELYKRLSGRAMTEEEMEHFVLTQTPFYKFKKAVRLLCSQERAEMITNAGWHVRFL